VYISLFPAFTSVSTATGVQFQGQASSVPEQSAKDAFQKALDARKAYEYKPGEPDPFLPKPQTSSKNLFPELSKTPLSKRQIQKLAAENDRRAGRPVSWINYYLGWPSKRGDPKEAIREARKMYDNSDRHRHLVDQNGNRFPVRKRS